MLHRNDNQITRVSSVTHLVIFCKDVLPLKNYFFENIYHEVGGKKGVAPQLYLRQLFRRMCN